MLVLGAALAAVPMAPGRAVAAAGEPSLVREPYMSAVTGLERDAYVYLPVGYEAELERRWPVILFLHGDGERGNGKDELDWVAAHGPLYEAWVQKRDLPFVMIVPQLPMFGRDETVDYIANRDPSQIPRRLADGVPPRPDRFPTPWPMTGAEADGAIPLGPQGPPDGWERCEDEVMALLDRVLANYRTDPDRVYLTGLSYGGFGTWYLAARHPRRFAAIAPVVGWGHPDLAKPLAEARLPVWAFAGGRDPVVAVKYFFAGLNELERLGHPDVRFTVHEDVGHDVWERVYGGSDLYDWLLSKRRAEDAGAGVEP
jgi:predicted peptidase